MQTKKRIKNRADVLFKRTHVIKSQYTCTTIETKSNTIRKRDGSALLVFKAALFNGQRSHQTN